MTVSPAMRRYAAEIYCLQQDNEQVSLSLLGSHVDSSAQAISTMVKRLGRNGYLVHEPYRGVRLTNEGEKIAMPALHRHRLTEAFLAKIMKAELRLVPGTPFHLLSCAPFKGLLRLQMKPQDHIIGYELAASLWVKVTKIGEGNKLPPLKIPKS